MCLSAGMCMSQCAVRELMLESILLERVSCLPLCMHAGVGELQASGDRPVPVLISPSFTRALSLNASPQVSMASTWPKETSSQSYFNNFTVGICVTSMNYLFCQWNKDKSVLPKPVNKELILIWKKRPSNYLFFKGSKREDTWGLCCGWMTFDPQIVSSYKGSRVNPIIKHTSPNPWVMSDAGRAEQCPSGLEFTEYLHLVCFLYFLQSHTWRNRQMSFSHRPGVYRREPEALLH